MNAQGSGFFVLVTPSATHLVNAVSVTEMAISESAGVPFGMDAEGEAAKP